MGIKADYADWKRAPDTVGCVFARMIARVPKDYATAVETINASSSAAQVAGSAAKVVERLVQAPEVAAAALLFPKVTTLDLMAAGFWLLGQKPGWHRTATALTHPSAGDLVAIALTREIANAGDAMLPSEVLAFGPFDPFPATRKAPCVALELFVGMPMELDPKTKDPATKVNLAHIRTPSLSVPTYENMIAMSGHFRRKSLGLSLVEGATDEDYRAKARVSFVVPKALATSLGIVP